MCWMGLIVCFSIIVLVSMLFFWLLVERWVGWLRFILSRIIFCMLKWIVGLLNWLVCLLRNWFLNGMIVVFLFWCCSWFRWFCFMFILVFYNMLNLSRLVGWCWVILILWLVRVVLILSWCGVVMVRFWVRVV